MIDRGTEADGCRGCSNKRLSDFFQWLLWAPPGNSHIEEKERKWTDVGGGVFEVFKLCVSCCSCVPLPSVSFWNGACSSFERLSAPTRTSRAAGIPVFAPGVSISHREDKELMLFQPPERQSSNTGFTTSRVPADTKADRLPQTCCRVAARGWILWNDSHQPAPRDAELIQVCHTSDKMRGRERAGETFHSVGGPFLGRMQRQGQVGKPGSQGVLVVHRVGRPPPFGVLVFSIPLQVRKLHLPLSIT
jgi:hypothetical protein